MFRLSVLISLMLALGGCSLIYKLPTRQGNVIDQKQLDQLKVGMTREQVRYLLGTPVASSSFQPDRWDYFGYYKPPRGKITTRTVTLYFDGDHLAKMQGTEVAANEPALGTPDFDALTKKDKKELIEKTNETKDTEKDQQHGGKPPAE